MRRPSLPTAVESPLPRSSICSACAVRDLAICSALDDRELAALSRLMRRQSVPARTGIVEEGEPADSVFNVIDGTVLLYRLLSNGRRQVVGFLFPGDFIGLDPAPRFSISAEAVDAVTVCRFGRAPFHNFLQEHRNLEQRLLRDASSELAQARERAVLLGRKTARERLASFVCEMSDRQVRRGRAPSPLHLPMTRSDIADYLGLTTETVSRSLTGLKKAGLIRIVKSEWIEVTAPAELREIAETG